MATADEIIKKVDKMADDSPDPDAFGIYDEIEYITGFGFVACQTYITATISRSGITRREALDLGPMHKTDSTFATLINSCANHWKHSAEWRGDNLRANAKKTIEVIASLGVDTDGSYPIANALHELLEPGPARFGSVLPFLTQWRDAVRGKAAAE